MIRLIASRIGFGIIILFALSLFVFLLFYVAPGDPARVIAGDQATGALLQQIRDQLGLNQPIYVQYFRFLGNALRGNLGFSYHSQLPVVSLIVARIPATVSLVFGGVVVWLLIGIPIGVMSARFPGSVRDRIGQGFTLVGLSFPTFVLGMLLLYVLYYWPRQSGFTLFPPGGYVPLTQGPAQWAWHLVLPWLTLAFVNAAIYARLTRGQLLDVLGEDYIRTARSKGISERRVIYKHGMRSTLTPIITQLGADIAMLLGGVIIIEQVFNIQGVGALAVTSVTDQDRPVIIGVVLLGGCFVVVANVIVDLLYGLLDPRVRTH
jgi:peptide/nickel transport system permease protein